jgi:putative methyltransferase
LTSNQLYRENLIILQDKASCFPPVILDPPVGAQVIDACAAPGNKTSQLCALVGAAGRVWAFERDPRRFQILEKLTSAAGVGARLKNKLADFLTVDPADPEYASVTHILCDPSCSGSGMPMSLERSLASSKENEDEAAVEKRLHQLSKFQCMIVKHAMRFPAVKRVVYSTCSIHAQENEIVVAEVLRDCPQFELVPKIFFDWPRRGDAKFAFAEDVIRADSKLDRMNGFFVALFERK